MTPTPEPRSISAWRQRAATLERDGRPRIGGSRTAALADDTFDVLDPSDGTRIATLPACGPQDVDRAVDVARQAFDSGAWSDLAPCQRADVLRGLAAAIETHAEELALLDSLQMGMPITQALADISVAAGTVRATAAWAETLQETVVPSSASALALNLRRPHGVVAALSAWNFPVYVALSKVVPALAVGNSVVLKPSELAPLACLRLADLASEAGVPAGAFNALPGLGPQAGRALALHPGVDCLTFTGSTATGQLLQQYAGQSNLKALLLECGGKSPQIVFDDLGDIDALADALVQGFTWNSGQVCVSGTRILVAGHLRARLSAALAERVAVASTGDPLDPGTALGPLANAAQFQRVTGFIAEAEGAPHSRLLARGVARGLNAVAPTLFDCRDASSALMQEEIFGPVAGLMPFETEADAVAMANATRYGLSATVWSRDLSLAHRVVRRLKAGFVTVNTRADPAPALAHGVAGEPVGLSGFGAEGGAGGLLAYTRQRSVVFHIA